MASLMLARAPVLIVHGIFTIVCMEYYECASVTDLFEWADDSINNLVECCMRLSLLMKSVRDR